MKKTIGEKTLLLLISFTLIFFLNLGYCSVDQILNDLFFQNPAELSLVKRMQFIVGNIYINPKLKFTGTSYGNTGTAVSRTNNSLPYFLTGFRITDKLVLGINATPSGYGHIQWPFDSIVIHDSTTTKLIYYRVGGQVSYQFNDRLSLGLGYNLQYHKIGELDFSIPHLGNQINKISGYNHTVDAGIYYKINSKNFFTAAFYSKVHTFNRGTSTLGPITVNNLHMTVAEGPVAYLGLQHKLTSKWYVEEKIYWSGWGIQKKLYLVNTTTGTQVAPNFWKNTLSFQVSASYSIYDNLALLASSIYETNPGGPVVTNSIGYPLSSSGSIAAGVEYTFYKNFSAQLVYGYGAFLPRAKIINPNDYGRVSAHTQAIAFQLSYKT